MKFVFPKPKKSTLLLAALWGALLFVGACYALNFFPHLGTIPTPTGGRLDFVMLGTTSVSFAAMGGALLGVFVVCVPTPVVDQTN
ncbi:hypothetical protein ACEN2T_17345 [Pseudomonas sp. W22_MBD1_FP4]|uniref:hypothetical protein n=1 Tax=Pseudomonas sp. W22_MBD1_FP4 TaxID=3240272 RepID=UPI003F94DEDA